MDSRRVVFNLTPQFLQCNEVEYQIHVKFVQKGMIIWTFYASF